MPDLSTTGAVALEPDAAIGPESLVVTVDTGERIHYLDWGGPDPPPLEVGQEAPHPTPLLLVHGLSQTAWSWTPVARRLRRATRVLAPDLRGHGLSEAPRAGYELDSLALDQLTVLSANGYGDDVGGPPAVVAGHGFGAQVAVAMAAIRPRSVFALTLVDGGWEALGEATGLSAAEFVRGLDEPPEVLQSMGSYLADRRAFDPATWDPDQERAARAAVDEKHAGHVAPVARPHVVRACVEAMFGYDPLASLVPLPQPLLVAVAGSGAADDEGARERALALDDISRLRAEEGLPPPRIVRYEGVGHNLMRYRATQLSAEIASLLEAARQR